MPFLPLQFHPRQNRTPHGSLLKCSDDIHCGRDYFASKAFRIAL